MANLLLMEQKELWLTSFIDLQVCFMIMTKVKLTLLVRFYIQQGLFLTEVHGWTLNLTLKTIYSAELTGAEKFLQPLFLKPLIWAPKRFFKISMKLILFTLKRKELVLSLFPQGSEDKHCQLI